MHDKYICGVVHFQKEHIPNILESHNHPSAFIAVGHVILVFLGPPLKSALPCSQKKAVLYLKPAKHLHISEKCDSTIREKS